MTLKSHIVTMPRALFSLNADCVAVFSLSKELVICDLRHSLWWNWCCSTFGLWRGI